MVCARLFSLGGLSEKRVATPFPNDLADLVDHSHLIGLGHFDDVDLAELAGLVKLADLVPTLLTSSVDIADLVDLIDLIGFLSAWPCRLS